jgi:HAD superfamily hydrolase (TIGR01509 family)
MDAVLLLKAIAPVALVSASPRNLMDAGLASLPTNLFEFTISSADVRRTKPHPDPYLAAATRLGVDPRECVVFEDSIPGITAARSAGMYVVAVPQFIEVAAASRQRVIATLEGLDRKFLNEIYQEN